MVHIYEWYIDVFFMVNFLMDTAGLFAAGILCNRKVWLWRLLAVGAGATIGSILLLLYLPSYRLYLLLTHVAINPLMVFLCYRPLSRWDFWRSLFAVYVTLFVAGGVQQSGKLYGMDSAGQILLAGFFAIGMFLLWAVQRRVLRRVCVAELEFLGECITIPAFCDSGNLLRDPDSGKAVNVIQRSALPECWVTPGMRSTGEGGLYFRRISYRTIGTDRSEIEIVTLDKMRIYRQGRVYEVEKPVFGLFDGTFLECPHVEMLLNGAYA